SHRRCDQPPSLSIGLSLYSNYRRARRSDGGGKNPPAQRRGFDPDVGYRRQYGIRPTRKLRYDDQASACRASGRKRRDCRAAGAGGIYIGDEYLRSTPGVLSCHGGGLWREEDCPEIRTAFLLAGSRGLHQNPSFVVAVSSG